MLRFHFLMQGSFSGTILQYSRIIPLKIAWKLLEWEKN